MAVNEQIQWATVRPLQHDDLLSAVRTTRHGDPGGADDLVRICRINLVSYLGRRGASDREGQADDILAEFLNRLPSLQFECEQQVWAYLYRMCRSSLSRDSMRAGIEQPAGLVVEDERTGLVEPIASLVDRLRVEEILDGLTPAQAQILRYRFLEDRSVKDTARLTGLSITAVKSLQLRGLRAARLAVLAASLAAIVVLGIMVIELSKAPIATDPSSIDADGSEPSLPVDTDERGALPGEGSEADRSASVTQGNLQGDSTPPATDSGIVMQDDFTEGAQPAPRGFIDLGPGDQTGEWAVRSSVSIDDAAHHGRDQAGTYLDLDDDGEMTRTIGGLTPGVVYQVRLDAARHPGATTASAVIEIDGSVLDIQPREAVGDGFEAFALTFTASADEVDLTLRGTGSSQPWGGVLIDGLVLEPLSDEEGPSPPTDGS